MVFKKPGEIWIPIACILAVPEINLTSEIQMLQCKTLLSDTQFIRILCKIMIL